MPKALVGLILHAYDDHVLSGEHLAFRPANDNIRQKIDGLSYGATCEIGEKNCTINAPLPEKKKRKKLVELFSIRRTAVEIGSSGAPSKKEYISRSNQLVVPKTLVALILHSYDDQVFRLTNDTICQNYCWPTICPDVRDWRENCQACQRTTKNCPQQTNALYSFLSVKRSFQGISLDLGEYKPMSTLATGIEF